ncbi:hypothetical protein FSW04_08815 [Baekduia soli]|uniref:Uncharacterized protein n=1 Tax=Baekduia soli TaxID=496014 RepID=A0A5B8U3R7_9ACTN|nr:hypothetical protein [Baekduia soli]QEC47663.1 hypothetical protein FSW04_08815 [Baekduia soli]
MPSLTDDLRTAPTTLRPFRADPVQPAALARAVHRARLAPWRVRAVTDPERRRAIRDAHLPHWAAHLAATGGLRIIADDAPARRARELRAADVFAHELHEVPVHLVVLARRAGTLRAGALGDLGDALRAEGLDAAPIPFTARAEPELRTLLALDDDLTIAGILVTRPQR